MANPFTNHTPCLPLEDRPTDAGSVALRGVDLPECGTYAWYRRIQNDGKHWVTFGHFLGSNRAILARGEPSIRALQAEGQGSNLW